MWVHIVIDKVKNTTFAVANRRRKMRIKVARRGVFLINRDEDIYKQGDKGDRCLHH